MTIRDLSALIGCEVRRVCIDYQVTLTLVEGPYDHERVNAGLQIEAPFSYTAKDGTKFDIEPNQAATLGPVVNLFNLTVLAVNFDGRTLTVAFQDGAQIEVPTLSQYESWNLTGAGVLGYIAGP